MTGTAWGIGDWERHLRAAGLPDTTISLRTYHVRRCARELQLELVDVTLEDLETWIGNPDWKPATKRSYRASLRVFWGWAMATGLVTSSPAHLLPSIRVPRAIPRPVPVDVYAAALRAADDRVRKALRLGKECGLRRGEIARARREDVEPDLVGYALRVQGKGGHVRLVPLPDDLAAEILNGPPGWLFPSPALPSHITPAHLGKLISRLLEGTSTTHSLRHRAGTDSLNATGDIRAVQEFLGHAKLDTVQIYTEVGRGQIRAAMMAAAAA
ncbi:tyrosine-type recombinase/integrase [Aeromicrobium sp. 9AM]|uniref:tyrosine-type recombinase/integrase n=1 Tax=Aeromicrobium sp. 9AM TaxID=2653126 RepID=UPI0012EF1280|nr:tyrosine-type recombinase/integrase [Aeromicrobium sp. 9AM]VXC21623.1 conserved hypothetical protein [Aeromicrobium sp. 9AM]